MKKMKRYEDGGEIDALEAANQSDESQAIANEAKGEAMLKAMRDKESAPKPKAKPAMPKAQYDSTKPKSTQTGASVPSMGASGTYGGGLGRRSHPEYPEDASKAMADMKQSKQKPATTTDYKNNPPSALSRFISNFSKGREDRLKRDKEMYGFAKGGKVSSASSRADGIAQRGKTRGKMC